MRQIRSRRKWTRPALRLATLAAALPVFATQAGAQGGGQGTVTGRVIDASTQAPIPEVQIRVLATNQAVTTRDNGTYRLIVPSGTVTVQALRVGYQASVARAIAVAPGSTITADFALNPAATTLDQVVVQATGETQRGREAGNLVNNLTADSVPAAAIASFSDALSGRAPGVQIQQFSGTTGGGSQIRIRGANSIALGNAPLLIIDGVRADNAESSGDASINTGGQGPSRFDDLDPNDIETIEVVKGPAGAAMYGSAGANGVIYVTTKQGTAGKTRWATHAEYGSVRNQTTFPANYDIQGDFGGGNIFSGCTLDNQHSGVCTATTGLNSFNPLQSLSPFVNGYRDTYGLSVSGGTDAAQYFLSGDYYREQGVYANNVNRRANGHATVTVHPSTKFDVSVSATYLQGRLSLPQNDNSFFGVLGLGLLGTAYNDAGHGYFEGITPDIIAQFQTLANTERYTTGVTGTWRPLTWFSATVQGGVDFLNRLDYGLLPPNLLLNNGPVSALGAIRADPAQIWGYTTNFTGTATYSLAPRIQAKTSLGGGYSDNSTRAFPVSTVGQIGTAGSVGLGTSQFTATEANTDQPTVAVYGQQEFSFNDRVFLTGTLRHESTGLVGEASPSTLYPAGSLSWVIGEEPFFPKSGLLSSLRLRAAVGEAGQLPDFRQAAIFYTAFPVKLDGQDVGAAVRGGFGSNNLIPERTLEYEAGFDAGLFHDRLNFTFTYYNKTTHDALISETLPASIGGTILGSPTRFVNIGETTNKGVELSLNGNVFRSRAVALDFAVTGSINRNKLVSLGNAAALGFIPFDAALAGEVQRFQPGLPMGGFFSFPYTYSDANHDGIITSDEITVSPNQQYMGPVMPPTEVTISPTLTLFKYFHVTSQFDHRDGNNILNFTEEFRCAFELCRGLYDAKAPLAQQAGDLVALGAGSDAYFINNAEFWKLRELTFAVDAPPSIVNRLRLAALRFSVSGRNLKTWTPYKGVDPEGNTSNTDFTNVEFTTQPPVRYWTARFDVAF
jgi:TonB-dependent starch-binding outer membrane protein SusC